MGDILFLASGITSTLPPSSYYSCTSFRVCLLIVHFLIMWIEHSAWSMARFDVTNVDRMTLVIDHRLLLFRMGIIEHI